MGSPATEQGRYNNEGPQHMVTIAKPFAVSKFDVTFADWDACVSVGGCPKAADSGFGRDTKPVINVGWDDAQTYVAWLSKMTGQPYRPAHGGRMGIRGSRRHHDGLLLGRRDRQGKRQLQWVRQPVGQPSRPHRSVRSPPISSASTTWRATCGNGCRIAIIDNYNGAPTDGSAWTSGDCSRRVVRGGSWNYVPQILRSAYRSRVSTDDRNYALGFRVGRTLTP